MELLEYWAHLFQHPLSWVPLIFFHLALFAGFWLRNRKAAIILLVAGWQTALMCAVCRYYGSFSGYACNPPPGQLMWDGMAAAAMPLVPVVVLTIPFFYMRAKELPSDWNRPVRQAFGGVLIAGLDCLIIVLSFSALLMLNPYYP